MMVRSYLSILREGLSTGAMGSIHRPVLPFLVPLRTRFWRKYTRHSSLSKMTRQPASQNLLIEMSDECANPGTICASVISAGSQGMSRFHSWVDLIVCPLGHVMRMGFCVDRTFVMGASHDKVARRTSVTDGETLTYFYARCGSFVCYVHRRVLIAGHVEAAVASVDLPLGYVTLEAAMVMSSSSTGGKGVGFDWLVIVTFNLFSTAAPNHHMCGGSTSAHVTRCPLGVMLLCLFLVHHAP